MKKLTVAIAVAALAGCNSSDEEIEATPDSPTDTLGACVGKYTAYVQPDGMSYHLVGAISKRENPALPYNWDSEYDGKVNLTVEYDESYCSDFDVDTAIYISKNSDSDYFAFERQTDVSAAQANLEMALMAPHQHLVVDSDIAVKVIRVVGVQKVFEWNSDTQEEHYRIEDTHSYTADYGDDFVFATLKYARFQLDENAMEFSTRSQLEGLIGDCANVGSECWAGYFHRTFDASQPQVYFAKKFKIDPDYAKAIVDMYFDSVEVPPIPMPVE
ncbi:hypothetical protein J4N45_14540 [Vibrio sp. SCSIO 43140]|uniref:hypothetical protein n=1 Tax=Vibrio sp. SCSIO 43140 TaxID=2819100 RepID=UPI002075C089|nr:hypothetical protein [Vibrio sp. SCSIO 43140]USD58794.1 hypothetical protein J4N45_09645 [Vibrio sp. SCSIO 43140]USD59128.1 hypothetical protein J4N45_11350 [Vibrio sp. SCSIO 43140]USD59719.1 hypothetical protein J4N45_14540 [Vibrio sp. SCSIO 43140]